MSTITEKSGFRRVGIFVSRVILVVLLWFVGAALVTYIAEPSETVIVFGPRDVSLAAMSQGDMRLVDGGPGFLVVFGDGPGFVGRLYQRGAWLVMPSNSDGCGLGPFLRERFGWT